MDSRDLPEDEISRSRDCLRGSVSESDVWLRASSLQYLNVVVEVLLVAGADDTRSGLRKVYATSL